MDHHIVILSQHLIAENRVSFINCSYIIETKTYIFVFGFDGFYFKLIDVVPTDLTLPVRTFKFTYSVFADTVSFDIYFYD